jgi:hypothetical protein
MINGFNLRSTLNSHRKSCERLLEYINSLSNHSPEIIQGRTPEALHHMLHLSKPTIHPSPLSPSMFHNITHHLPTSPNNRPNLLRQRHLLIILLPALKNIQVNPRTFTREDFRAHTVFTQINLSAVYGVHEDGGECAQDLESEVGGFDHIDGGD